VLLGGIPDSAVMDGVSKTVDGAFVRTTVVGAGASVVGSTVCWGGALVDLYSYI
jgi:hypothetical protein